MKKYVIIIVLAVFILLIGYQIMDYYIPQQSNSEILECEPVIIDHQPEAVHAYDLEVILDTEQHTIGGKETIAVKNNSEDVWQEIYLRDYASCMYENVKLTDFLQLTDGENDLDYHRDKTDPSIVRIPLKEDLMPGDTMTLEIHYQSYIHQKSRNRLNYRLESSGLQVNEKYALGCFYPVLSVYEDGNWINHTFLDGHEPFYTELSHYRVSITVPKDFIVSAGGDLIEVTENNETGQLTYHYQVNNVRDFAMSASNIYEVVSEMVDGITVYSYYYRGCKMGGDAALKAGIQGLKLFNRYLGKYPYHSFTIAAVPELPGGGMEYPSYVMILGDYYRENEDNKISKGLERVVVHELAHQWFYGIVGNDQYNDAWLDESLASAMELIYYDYFDDDRYKAESAHIDHKSIKITKSAGELGDDYPGVYSSGQFFMMRIRQRMGEEDFIKAMQAYVAAYAFQVAKSENILSIFSEHSSKSLLSLYKKYIEKDYY